MVLTSLALISGLSFGIYGYQTLFGLRPRQEFERYAMARLRTFVGTMQLLGAAAVLMGLGLPLLGALGALGLMTMMALGVAVRIRIHDPARLMAPAATLGVVNAVLAVLFVGQIVGADSAAGP